MNKKKIALILNIIIFILEVIGFSYYFYKNQSMSIEYYTMDSNLLALITSFLFILMYKGEKEWIKDLRFITTSCLTLTFLVVVFILCPMYNFNYIEFMFQKEFLLFHTICPILSITSYIFYEDRSKHRYLGFLFTILYSIILSVLNVIDIITGPYPFLRVKEQSIIMTIIWCLLIVGGSYLIGLGLNYLNKKCKRS